MSSYKIKFLLRYLKLLNLSHSLAFIISLLTFPILLFCLNSSILMNSASLITLIY